MKKISYGLTILLLVGAFVFGLNTNVSALQYVFNYKEEGIKNPFSWSYSQLIEFLDKKEQSEIGNILTEESWNNYTEPDLDSDVDPFPDFSSASIVAIKSNHLIGFFTGDHIPMDWGELPDGMNSISSVAVPEPSVLISLGIVLISLTVVQRKRFRRSQK